MESFLYLCECVMTWTWLWLLARVSRSLCVYVLTYYACVWCADLARLRLGCLGVCVANECVRHRVSRRISLPTSAYTCAHANAVLDSFPRLLYVTCVDVWVNVFCCAVARVVQRIVLLSTVDVCVRDITLIDIFCYSASCVCPLRPSLARTLVETYRHMIAYAF